MLQSAVCNGSASAGLWHQRLPHRNPPPATPIRPATPALRNQQNDHDCAPLGTVCDTLATHQVARIVLPTDGGKLLRIRKGTTPEPNHRELYELLGVPPEVMQPIKTWSRSFPPRHRD